MTESKKQVEIAKYEIENAIHSKYLHNNNFNYEEVVGYLENLVVELKEL